MAVKNKRRSVPKDAAAFARWVEEQAATDDWIATLYAVQPAVETRLAIVPERKAG